jgi:hypothetical protein
MKIGAQERKRVVALVMHAFGKKGKAGRVRLSGSRHKISRDSSEQVVLASCAAPRISGRLPNLPGKIARTNLNERFSPQQPIHLIPTLHDPHLHQLIRL